MIPLILSPVRLLQRWLGWSWVVLVVRRDKDGVALHKLPNDLPVSVRPNTDDSVSVTIGHENDGSALLADVRSLVRDRALEKTMVRT